MLLLVITEVSYIKLSHNFSGGFMDYLSLANSPVLYLVVGGVLLFIALGCLYFIIKFYRAGLRIGMEKSVLKKAITSSALFTVLPAVSILLGVIALSGSLGIPTAWLRLSVVGNLSYEAIAAEAAAQGMGIPLDSSVLNSQSLVTILAVMTAGISWGVLCTIFICPWYSRKCNKLLNRKSGEKKEGKSFSDWAMISMFIGFCGTFIGSYIARSVNSLIRGGDVSSSSVPLITALVAALVMKLMTVLEKSGHKWIENFSLSLSMLVAMAVAAIVC